MKRFDLHIHTISTVSDSAFEFSLDALYQYVEQRRLDAIAITNHNCFNVNQYRLIKDRIGDKATVFPGIEINVLNRKGSGFGHLIILSEPSSVEDFGTRCYEIEKRIVNADDGVTLEFIKETFANLNEYLLIPHYDKSPAVDSIILNDLAEFIVCGEVCSIKKFIYRQRDSKSLTPVYFSDWRACFDSDFPTRNTWIDINEINISSLKHALSDKTKVQLSEEEGHHLFQALDDVKLSTGLTVILGGRSSGKSYTLNRINNAYENVKYIKQFSLLDRDPEKAEADFARKIAEKQSVAMRDFFQPFSRVVDDVVNISLVSDEKELDNYLSSLIKHASEVSRADMYSKCSLYSESGYTINDLENLRRLITAVEDLIDTREYKSIVEKNISKSSLISLHTDLINKFVEEKQLALKKIWINDFVEDIKSKLQRRTADTRVADVDFYSIQMNRVKVQRFRELTSLVKRPSVIEKQDIEGFIVQMSKRPYGNSGELMSQCGRKIKFSDIFEWYQSDDYEYLINLSKKDGIEARDYYLYFAKVDYKILNKYGFEVSGGERAEFNLLQQIKDAFLADMLLIDEPESSFDNIFLRDHVNHIIKEISAKMPVVIVTHNNTVGASIKPDYIVHTRRSIVSGKPVFELYSGYPSDKVLVNNTGQTIPNIDVTLDCLEAGLTAYENRRIDYEMLKN